MAEKGLLVVDRRFCRRFSDDRNPNWSKRPPLETILLEGNVHGSLARAGKVRGQTLKVAKQDMKKKPRGRAHKRMQYNRHFVTTGGGIEKSCERGRERERDKSRERSHDRPRDRDHRCRAGPRDLDTQD
ncbi:uncharacterized protein LOC131313340 [Rhododendron vialii]|uniref:uncharacterized protein LOC131313340 n=1 Tax=Rhododendron vialii TaxID=182163 RepID=UPI00265E7115|nr:uncharacterized protein LOC131313340 [Rhododendron vialii]XP_058197585.1 uncharacterized protein LOC131313340 [Rhododendron vialii]XP_058197586.1 uncharacterized protein LOC131313340 [Rhododendron vialii]